VVGCVFYLAIQTFSVRYQRRSCKQITLSGPSKASQFGNEL
jgi:hypothetical protein